MAVFDSPEAASRFLRRASFGASRREIEAAYRQGPRDWLQAQRDLARSDRYLDFLRRKGPPGRTLPRTNPRLLVHEAFWFQAAAGADQLRQRVAFALSQILVVSAEDPFVASVPESLATYMDLIADHALGNYRDLLIAVATSPAMGTYLTHIRNERADRRSGRQPDENFAREVMQLFTIGLWQLNPDGTPKRDAAGALIPTYGQDDISGMARVFTGWSWGGGKPSANRFQGKPIPGEKGPRWDVPMVAWEPMHESGEKRLIDAVVIEEGVKARESLERAIDLLFQHPNTPPFVAYRLIQRLVSSNPSPAYVRAVADVFADNGSGERGDLFATVSAILLHPEAADGPGTHAQAGRLREPFLRISQWLRAYGDAGPFFRGDVGLSITQIGNQIGQQPYRAPSVFNWYGPDYAPVGPLADADLVAPEFKLHTDPLIVSYSRLVALLVEKGIDMRDKAAQAQYPGLERLAATPAALVNELNLVLCAGQLSGAAQALIAGAVDRVPAADALTRVHTALTMVMLSADYLVEV